MYYYYCLLFFILIVFIIITITIIIIVMSQEFLIISNFIFYDYSILNTFIIILWLIHNLYFNMFQYI